MPSDVQDPVASLDRQLSLELDTLSQLHSKSPSSSIVGGYDNPAFRNSCLQLMTSAAYSCSASPSIGAPRHSDEAGSSTTVRASWSSGSVAVNGQVDVLSPSTISPPMPSLTASLPSSPTGSPSKTNFWQGVLGCLRPVWTVLSVRVAAAGAGLSSGRHRTNQPAQPWTLDLMDILDLQFLASGTQGSVFLGVYNGQQVAMKKFNEPPDVQLRELRHLASLRHPNVVRFIGCIDANISLVMEFCQHGNLFDYYNNPATCISAARVADWARQLADGMAYLHWNRIVHGDLKSPNILLCELDTLKISDFGLVRLPSDADHRQQQQQQLYGTVRWMSPEQCRQELWSYPADVFSYGVILWEMLFQEVPYRSVDPWAVVLGVGQGTLALPLPCHTPSIMRTLMEACWTCKPKQRPAFRNIGRSLEASLLDLLELSDGDLRILRKAWSAEIASQLSSMRQDDFKAKLEADLIRKRKEELQHAQEIRQHYEKRLRRVDDLQMDLTNLRLQLQLQAKAERDRSTRLRSLIRRRCCPTCKRSLRAVCSREQLSAAVVLDQPLLDAATAAVAAAAIATDPAVLQQQQQQQASASPNIGDRGGRPRRASRRLSKALTLPVGGVAAAAALFRRGGAPPPPPPAPFAPSARDAWVQTSPASVLPIPPSAAPSVGEPQLRARPGRRRYQPAAGQLQQQQLEPTNAAPPSVAATSSSVDSGSSGLGYSNSRLPKHLLQSTDLLSQELQEHLAATASFVNPGYSPSSTTAAAAVRNGCDSLSDREHRLAQLKLDRQISACAAANAAAAVHTRAPASVEGTADGVGDSRDSSHLDFNRSASADPKSEDDLELEVDVDVLHDTDEFDNDDEQAAFDSVTVQSDRQNFRPNSSII